MSQVWTMKLTASTNFCYISDRNACKVKVNIKETFIGINGFLHLVFSEGRTDSCHSGKILDLC